jgi:CheY-like chemotaxis protein
MTFQPKRPSVPVGPPSQPSSKPGSPLGPPTPSSARPPVGHPSARPANIRDAITEAHALGGGAVARPSATAQAATKKTVMLVDPDAGLRARLRAMLTEHYDIVEASDGMEAMDVLAKIQMPALVVCDTAMPRVDGFTFAKFLRQSPLLKRVPVIFVSAQTGPQYVTQALVIGVSQYLPKTTPLAQIVEKVRKIAL